MVTGPLGRFLRHPLRTLRNAFSKLLVGPLKYGKPGGYDAERYWRERFLKHGLSLSGPGDEGLSEAENRRAYAAAARRLTDLCRDEGVRLRGARALDIGVGTGFYALWLREAGVSAYTGLDITDVLFPHLCREFPGFTFLKGDVTRDRIEGTYDVILMMDVVEHIVTGEALRAAMENVRQALAPGGTFLLTGVRDRTRKNLFYEHSWAPGNVVGAFPGFACRGPFPYRENYLLILRREGPAPAGPASPAGADPREGPA